MRFVVPDPRANRRKPKKPAGPTPLPNSEIVHLVSRPAEGWTRKLWWWQETTTEAYTTPALPAPDAGSLFLLPKVDGETMLIEIPQDYALSDFEWSPPSSFLRGLG